MFGGNFDLMSIQRDCRQDLSVFAVPLSRSQAYTDGAQLLNNIVGRVDVSTVVYGIKSDSRRFHLVTLPVPTIAGEVSESAPHDGI